MLYYWYKLGKGMFALTDKKKKSSIIIFTIFVFMFILVVVYEKGLEDVENRVTSTGDIELDMRNSTVVKDKVTKLVNKWLGEDVSDPDVKDKKRVKEIRTIENAITSNIHDRIVYMELNADIPYKQETLKKELLRDSKKILEKIFDIKEVSEVDLKWYNTFYDANGNSSQQTSMRINLTKRDVERIIWDKLDYKDLEDKANSYWEHDALKGID